MKTHKVTVYSLVINSSGENEFVKSSIKALTKDPDEDVSVQVAEHDAQLTSAGYTVCGSFLESEPAAQQLNKAAVL